MAASEVAARQATLNNLTSTAPPTTGEIATAERELAIAQANVDTVRLAGERSEDEAATAAAEALTDASVRSAEVRAAESCGRQCQVRRSRHAFIGGRPPPRKQADLARRQAGVQVPADEIVFVATGPVRLSELLVGTGDPVAGGIMTVTDAIVHVDGGLPVEAAGLVKPGMAVLIEEPDLGIDTEGTVGLVAPAPGTNGVDGFHVYFTVDVPKPPNNLVGASVRLTIPVESSAGKVLSVPISALTLSADGSSRVQRSTDGVTEFVQVEAGLSADGFVEVAAVDGSLKEGDLVVIGMDQASATVDSVPEVIVAAREPDVLQPRTLPSAERRVGSSG